MGACPPRRHSQAERELVSTAGANFCDSLNGFILREAHFALCLLDAVIVSSRQYFCEGYVQ